MDAQSINKQPCRRDDAVDIVKHLRAAGHTAYFAGGCVRDELLGHHPKDYDIATNATPQQVRSLFPHTEAVGAAFGVILVRHRRSVVEVATFRSDGTYTDGRRPQQVQFTTARDDAQRRDFTINGLFLDPLTNDVIDYVDGQADLENHQLRAIGQADLRFREDHLRLLRAVRFAARYDLRIVPDTAEAIRRHASQLVRISPERIADELRHIFTSPSRSRAWRLLWDFSLIGVIFRFLAQHPPPQLNPSRSIVLHLDPPASLPFGSILAIVALDYQYQAHAPDFDLRDLLTNTAIQTAASASRKALKISNDESAQLSQTLRNLQPLLADPNPSIATLKRFLAQPTASPTRALLGALCALGLFTSRIAQLNQQFVQLAQTEIAPVPLVTGDDLVAAGYHPGPAFKRVLDQLYDAQLEGQITSTAQALAQAAAYFSQAATSPRRRA